ncbi:MAG: hypothetical protein M3Y42_16860, partial [Actinomycetota bacterium]|nr:hypothetical protein [Actinomycetota bacterium]
MAISLSEAAGPSLDAAIVHNESPAVTVTWRSGAVAGGGVSRGWRGPVGGRAPSGGADWPGVAGGALLAGGLVLLSPE